MLEVDRIIVDQSGLIARRQALGPRLSTSDIAGGSAGASGRWYIRVSSSTTPVSWWLQRAWAAVLFSWPAACATSPPSARPRGRVAGTATTP